MMVRSFFIVYLIVWLLLLVDCLRRKRFYPLLGSDLATRIFWLVSFLFFNPVVTLFYVVFGCLKQPPLRAAGWAKGLVVLAVVVVATAGLLSSGSVGREAFSFVRENADGKWTVEGENGEGSIAYDLASIDAINNIVSSWSSAHSDEAAFACGRVVILNDSEHRLLERVGAELAERLTTLPFVRRVEYYPFAEYPKVGTRRPDVTITLSASRIGEIPLPGYRSLDAVIHVTASSSPWTMPVAYSVYGETPPILQFSWEGNLKHSSKIKGYVSGAARYRLVAQNISKQIADALVERFGQCVEKHGILPPLPDAFFGPYTSPVDVPFNDMDACELLMSTHGLYEHNRSWWRLQDGREPAVALVALSDQLSEAGWEARPGYGTDEASDGGNDQPVLRMTKGDRSVSASVWHESPGSGAAVWHSGGDGGEPNQLPIIIQYTEPFTQEERCAALEHLLEHDVPIEAIRRFERSGSICSRELDARFLARLEQDHPTSAKAYLRLAQRYHRENRDAEARTAAVGAAVLARVRGEGGDLKSQFDQLNKKLGTEDLLNAPLDADVLNGLGCVELTREILPFEHEVRLGEPVVFFYRHESGELMPVCTEVRRQSNAVSTPGEHPPYELVYHEAIPHGHMSVAIGMIRYHDGIDRTTTTASVGELSVTITAEATTAERFQITISDQSPP